MQGHIKWAEGPRKNALFTQPALSSFRPRALAIMLLVSILFILYTLYGRATGKPIPYSQAPETPLIVELPDYGTFRGTQVISTLNYTSFIGPVDAWLGIEYATQPVGHHRFAPPEWPRKRNGTRDANEYGPICIQNPASTSLPQSEACLNLNIYRTSGMPFHKKLPVLVYIHGGSFVGGSGRSFDGAAFVSKSRQPIMVVTLQYRLGALGSLPSSLFQDEGLLNLGILDQRLSLLFLQKYISSFGGDVDGITLAGQSAGGHSVGIHLFHNYGHDAGRLLFSQAILSSGSPTARAFPPATYPLYQRQFQEFMDYLQCPTSPNYKAIGCLKSVDASIIQSSQAQIYSASEYNITWPFQPVSPGPLLEKKGSQSGEDGTFFKVPILISSTTDEGKGFAPQNLTTTDHFLNFLRNLNPGLTDADLSDLKTLYPDPDDNTSPYANSPISAQYNRISAAYGDYSYICPVQETAYRLSEAGVPVYKARFNTPNNAPVWQGVPHASDALYFNGVSNVQFPDISDLYSSYWASFVVSGDPNAYAIQDAPRWDVYEGLGAGELKVGSLDGTGTAMEGEAEGIRMKQCAWWRDPERMKRLNK